MFSFVSDELTIKALFDTCDKFTIVSGLKLNKEKKSNNLALALEK